MKDLRNYMEHLTSLSDATMTETLSERPACEVCRETYTIDTAPTWEELCAEHQTAVNRRLEERLLQNVLPKTFHKAVVEDIPKSLSTWTGTNGIGIYIHGTVGSGKSHLAAALTKLWYRNRLTTCDNTESTNLSRYPRIVWQNMPDLIQRTRAAFGTRTNAADPEQLWLEAQTAELLVIDDIGIEAPKDWIKQRLYSLVEYRLHEQLPTIWTSNKNLPSLARHLDSTQIISRIKQTTQTIQTNHNTDRRATQTPPNTPKHP